MKKLCKLIAPVLILCLLLSGCGLTEALDELAGALEDYAGSKDSTDEYASFSRMEYVRPDMETFEALKNGVLIGAKTATDVEILMESVNEFFDAYQWFYTYLNLADIHYCIDMTDAYWQTEYNYCMEQSATVDAAREDVLYALGASPLRQELESEDYFGAGYFDAYQGESVYDETFLALMDEEAAILNEYYQVSAEAASVEYASEEYYTTYGTELAELLVELVKVRQAQAAYVGYDSYPAFAYDFYHGRSFTPEQAEAYTRTVAETLTDLYRQVNTQFNWSSLYKYCSEEDTLAYVQKSAQAMGGDIADGFAWLKEYGLYHISPGQNKYNSSFEIYLTCYDQPFIFMNPLSDPSDKLTFAHEFGHYMADYYTWGSDAGTDVLEVHSQAMEYLSLVYGQAEESLVDYKLASCLCNYVEQSAYALFEQEMYELKGDELTVENVQALYERIGMEFGFDSWGWDSRDFVTVPHFYGYPMYVISYVVSNDVAFQVYQTELETSGAGLEVYEQMLSSAQWNIMDFAAQHGLQDPLDPARLETVRDTLSTIID